MTKRILCLLLAFIMLFGVCSSLASCTPDEPVDPNYKDEGERTEDEFDNAEDAAVSKYYEYTWSTTNLNVEISEHTASQELISRTRRYLAGAVEGANEPLDKDVRTRNSRAEKVTRTKINYTYLDDVAGNGWGKSMDRIAKEAKSGAENSADIYINFIYDMVGASLQKAFANLRSTTMLGSKDKNYFEFTAADYDPIKDDEGYMYDLMNSLSFSTKKMYVLTSDYLIDVVRAFFVVPVNIKMINGIDVTMVDQYNIDGDDKFNVDDFFNGVVWNNKWNYDAVRVFSEAVAYQAGEKVSFQNDTFGFALGSATSGIHGVGILYGSDVEIITRELGDDGFYNVYYPNSAEDSGYAQFCDALATLFSSKGVYDVDRNKQGKTPSQQITEKFAANQMLFGGVICAGNLELDEYQKMNNEQGFGVAPVPMYREFDANKDYDAEGINRYYRTASHNIAKCAGIAYSTTKFKQCAAWLDYQSTHSTDILNTYYEDKLQYGYANSNPHNVDVLEMLRNNVSTALDKCYDDAIKAKFPDSDWRWCYLPRAAHWKALDIRTQYNTAVELKQGFLEEIRVSYDNLPE